MSLNHQKYLSYREAWDRINAAIEKGFYFEAVTICESIISDRLLSFVCGVCPSTKKPRSSLGELINDWRRLVSSNLEFKGSPNLIDEVDEWRKERNVIVHGLVKSAPGTPTDDVAGFLVRAQEAAESGKRLARLVCDWHKQQLSVRNV